MKAAVLKSLGSPLAIETVPAPELGSGEVIVDVTASRVLAYAGEVFSGARNYLLELPIIPGPGAIGRVRAAGPDATRLRPGFAPETGCIAIRPFGRATAGCHPTSPCRA
jgi:alcohol dehydrogenase